MVFATLIQRELLYTCF